MKKMILAFILALSVFGTSMAQANLIVNGGFESPDISPLPWENFPNSGISGWTVHDVDLVAKIYYDPSSGNQSLDLNGWGPGYISQNFATILGQTYTLTFDVAGNPLGSGPAVKLYDVIGTSGLVLFNSFDTTSTNATNMGWTTLGYNFTALSDLTNIEFFSPGGGTGGAALDNVAVNPVPEPGTMMLLGAGFLGLAVYGKRRKNA